MNHQQQLQQGEPPLFNGQRTELLVCTQRAELMFRDHSRAYLHTVLRNGLPDKYLRAVPHAAGDYIVDVRNLVPSLGAELCLAEPRDVIYLVFMTLKLHFANVDAFMSAVLTHRISNQHTAAA
ncbi:MAG: hypothetical protein ABI605_11025 [Rhizobacter sp.]